MVLLRAKLRHVATHRLQVCLQRSTTLGWRLGCIITEVIGERHLRVDNNILSARQAHNHIGTHVAALIYGHCALHLVVDALRQARVVKDGLKNSLTPIALHLRVALQCIGKVGGLGGDLRIEFHQTL